MKEKPFYIYKVDNKNRVYRCKVNNKGKIIEKKRAYKIASPFIESLNLIKNKKEVKRMTESTMENKEVQTTEQPITPTPTSISSKLIPPGTRIKQLLAEGKTDYEIIEQIKNEITEGKVKACAYPLPTYVRALRCKAKKKSQ